MDFRNNQASGAGPQNQQNPAPAPRFGGNSGGNGNNNAATPSGEHKKTWLIVAVCALAVVVVVVMAMWVWGSMTNSGGNGKGQAAVKPNQYQAIFLTNGQVYFGKLASVDSDYIELKDIYYLQVQQSVQPAETQTPANGEQPKVSLAKLGQELHGPEDEMQINREQVLFWENLNNDSKVVKAITEHKGK